MAHPGGRPVKFTPDEFWDVFIDYIRNCKTEGKLLPNIAGFSVFAGFHPDTFYEYKNNRPEYSDVIKRIEAVIEDSAINCKDTIKGIFYLKNKFGYTDKTEQVLTAQIEAIPVNEAQLEAQICRLLEKHNAIDILPEAKPLLEGGGDD